MEPVTRFSVSVEKPLREKLDALMHSCGYENRSEFVRDLVRKAVVERDWANDDREVVATLTILYDHHAYMLSKKLTDIQHDHHEIVLTTTHVHLSHHLCAEMIMLKGPARAIRAMADMAGKQKGVLHSALSLSSTGEGLHYEEPGANTATTSHSQRSSQRRTHRTGRRG